MNNSELFDKAVSAAEKAYSKYSGFCVGAALLTDNGEVYTGCNIENSSYSLTVCAERTALFKAVSEGKREFSAIAVAGSENADYYAEKCVPCGACLQVLSEFCDDSFKIILSDGEYLLSDFLPIRFDNIK